MYDGSTLLFVAKAVAEGSPVGLLLAAWVYVVYALARAAEEYVGCVALRVGWTCLASRAGRAVAACVSGEGGGIVALLIRDGAARIARVLRGQCALRIEAAAFLCRWLTCLLLFASTAAVAVDAHSTCDGCLVG